MNLSKNTATKIERIAHCASAIFSTLASQTASNPPADQTAVYLRDCATLPFA